mmetsp:Transcript_43590/g.115108  ORF Transcript_43590/g.115108 Transcript_43590/m.115108 type:complete len:117 (-) Transcript_43590:279-629(-)
MSDGDMNVSEYKSYSKTSQWCRWFMHQRRPQPPVGLQMVWQSSASAWHSDAKTKPPKGERRQVTQEEEHTRPQDRYRGKVVHQKGETESGAQSRAGKQPPCGWCPKMLGYSALWRD